MADTLTAIEARTQARKLLAKVELGRDPQGEREDQRRQATGTFRSIAAQYLADRQSKLRPASFRVTQMYLTGSYFAPLHAADAAAITHADVAAALRRIKAQHSEGTARQARLALSAMYGWAIAEGLLGKSPVNPVIGTHAMDAPPPRERVLSPAELVAIWRASGDDDYGRVIKLLILLGARRSEIGGLRPSELDPDKGTWRLPAERSKNGRALELVLPAAAWAIIETVPRREGCDYLFGPRHGAGFKAWSASKAALDVELGEAVAAWRVHDIRRTVATGMADIGIEPHHIEAVLNHHGGHRAGVAGIYNRSSYERAVTAALARWSEHVEQLVSGKPAQAEIVRLRK
jgi:integrase